MTTIETRSPRLGRGRPRPSAITARQAAPTRSRPSERAPGEKSWPRWRIATNAEAQSTRVTPTAASGSQVRAGGVLITCPA